MILGVTGHRPQELGGYQIPNRIYSFIVAQSKQIIEECKPEKIITGMCIGYDQWIAEIAISLNIPFIAAVPFVDQERIWTKDSQAHYKDLLAHAEQVVVVNAGGYAAWKMQARNRWIVDNSNSMLAAFNGSHGGTYNCLEYARIKNKPIQTINPLEAVK